ncbi:MULTISPECIES: hypothetical protein [unclassified Streptomyces]|uniref:hypothetical protein n=1 Tax=unclassified Streptomyces TaxID=2593676 RepID=UPI002E2D80C4|nr:hypothetical protein [Streptomyces sp. NBC_00223]
MLVAPLSVRGAGQCLAIHRDRWRQRRADAAIGVVAFGQVGANRDVQGIAVEGGQSRMRMAWDGARRGPGRLRWMPSCSSSVMVAR